MNLIPRKNKRLESEQTDGIFSLDDKEKSESISLLMMKKIEELEEEIEKLRNENVNLRIKIIRLK